jgi:cell division septation protein DedD
LGVPSSSAASQGWAVQLGSFASFANAEKLLRQLKAQGYLAYVSSSGVGTSMRYRVRVGPLSDRGTAAHTVAKLKEAGLTATIVPPAP